MASHAGTAVVSGAGRGIGRAIARALAADGWQVVGIDGPATSTLPYPLTSPAGLADDGEVHLIAADVRDPAALATALAPYRPVRLAVAAAGVIAGAPSSLALPEEQARELMEVNFWGLARLAQCVIEDLRATKGCFIGVTSAGGTRGLPRLAHYCASKHAATGFLLALAREEAPAGVRILAVAPGSTRTAMLEESARIYGLASAAQFAAHHADGTLNDPEDIARVIAFLAREDARAINAAVISVDRGFSG
jgi:NAD(P)-dependent dehydrogenase (short-subunit alcohol dehydrogenase family)